MATSQEFIPSGPEFIPPHLEITGGIRRETQEVLSFIKEAESQPHILDNYLLRRIDNLGIQNEEAFDTYSKQVSLWRLETLNQQQEIQVSLIEENIAAIKQATDKIVEIIDKCRGKTIDDISVENAFDIWLESLMTGAEHNKNGKKKSKKFKKKR